MSRRKTQIGAMIALSGVCMFASIGSVSASGAKYSTYSTLVEGPKVLVKYGSTSTVKNSSLNCPDKAFNVGNNGDVFYFSKCSFPNINPPTFEADNELLNLWQVGRESIRSDISNKAKFEIYSTLFQAMNNSFDVDSPGNPHTDGFAWQDEQIEKMKKKITGPNLFSHSGAYNVNAMDFLWRTPEISPQRYYTPEQKTAYQDFEKKALALISKTNKIKSSKERTKIKKALEKTLKDTKKKTDNDEYLLQMLEYRVIIKK